MGIGTALALLGVLVVSVTSQQIARWRTGRRTGR
jgi:hypothetical protein